jgi:hypothetical protein
LVRISFQRTVFASLKVQLCAGLLLVSNTFYGAEYPSLAPAQVDWIGDQIFNNECDRQPGCLTAWNQGENFPSLGIGHFIWFQAKQEEIFEESFPELLRYFIAEGVKIPTWIDTVNLDSPWHNRDAFLADIDSEQMQELRSFLAQHSRQQTRFIINRFDSALDKILDSEASITTRTRLQENFYAVANSSPPHGLYALIDYVNFKGTGTSEQETYQAQGWGLKQVLLGMATHDHLPPIQAFIQSARDTLQARVNHAPAERNEQRWLSGWNNRLDTYSP